MKAAISVELGGARFAVDAGAFVALRAYLERASARLGSHPDRDEVMAGLERSIAGKLAARQLYRVREGQRIAGVCKGLAVFTGVDVGIVRLVFLMGALFSGGVVAVAYVVLMLIMPTAPSD